MLAKASKNLLFFFLKKSIWYQCAGTNKNAKCDGKVKWLTDWPKMRQWCSWDCSWNVKMRLVMRHCLQVADNEMRWWYGGRGCDLGCVNGKWVLLAASSAPTYWRGTVNLFKELGGETCYQLDTVRPPCLTDNQMNAYSFANV